MKSIVALITGSGRNRVGNAIAESLADDGHSVAVHYHRSQKQAMETVERLRQRGVQSEAYPCDVTKEAEVDAMFERMLEAFGRIDLLVTTASIYDSKPLEEVTAEDIRHHFDLNALGTFLCARRAGLAMVEQSAGGLVVTIGDWGINRPYVDYAPYFISKGAIPTMTRALAVEMATRNPKVRVNCIHPGPVLLPPSLSRQEQESILQATLVKQVNRPDAIASTVKYFLQNDFVTGVCLPVDGGRSIYNSGGQ